LTRTLRPARAEPIPEEGFALFLALQSPEVDVTVVTVVHGNVLHVHGFADATYLLERRNMLVALGMGTPLLPRRVRADLIVRGFRSTVRLSAKA